MREVIIDLNKKIIESNVDSFNAKGNVRIRVFDKDGKLVETIENHNLIVKSGRSELIKKIAGTSTLNKIGKCAVGNGGALQATPFNPISPVDGDTTLGAQVFIKDVGTAATDLSGTNPQVTFTTLFTCAEVNSLVNECGLFFTDGTTIFARYTFKTVSLENTSGFSMEIDWTIQF
jgi:hypothetical protein